MNFRIALSGSVKNVIKPLIIRWGLYLPANGLGQYSHFNKINSFNP